MGRFLKRLGSGACDALQAMITDAVLAAFNESTLADVSADVAVQLMLGASDELQADIEQLDGDAVRQKWLNEVRYAVADAISGLGAKIDVQQDASVLEYMASRPNAMSVIHEFEALVVADATSEANLTKAADVVDQAVALAESRAA